MPAKSNPKKVSYLPFPIEITCSKYTSHLLQEEAKTVKEPIVEVIETSSVTETETSSAEGFAFKEIKPSKRMNSTTPCKHGLECSFLKKGTCFYLIHEKVTKPKEHRKYKMCELASNPEDCPKVKRGQFCGYAHRPEELYVPPCRFGKNCPDKEKCNSDRKRDHSGIPENCPRGHRCDRQTSNCYLTHECEPIECRDGLGCRRQHTTCIYTHSVEKVKAKCYQGAKCTRKDCWFSHEVEEVEEVKEEAPEFTQFIFPPVSPSTEAYRPNPDTPNFKSIDFESGPLQCNEYDKQEQTLECSNMQVEQVIELIGKMKKIRTVILNL